MHRVRLEYKNTERVKTVKKKKQTRILRTELGGRKSLREKKTFVFTRPSRFSRNITLHMGKWYTVRVGNDSRHVTRTYIVRFTRIGDVVTKILN